MARHEQVLTYYDAALDDVRGYMQPPKPAATPEATAPTTAIDANAEVAEFNDAVEQKFVPTSYEDASALVNTLRTADEAIQNDVAEGRRTVEPDILASFHEKAEKGLGNWRLSHDERVQWARITGMRSAKELSGEMRSFMDGLSPDSENEASTLKFKRLVTQAHARLKLDDEIAAHEAAAPKKREYTPGQVVAKLAKDGSRRVFVADEDPNVANTKRKLRPLRQDDVLTYYGMEGQEEGKPLKLTVVPESTADSAKSGAVKTEKQLKLLVKPDPEGVPHETEADFTPTDSEAEEVVTPQGRRLHVRSIMKRAAQRLKLLHATVKSELGHMTVMGPREYFTDKEYGKKRKVVAASVLGAVAVVGLLMETKGFGISSHLQEQSAGVAGAVPPSSGKLPDQSVIDALTGRSKTGAADPNILAALGSGTGHNPAGVVEKVAKAHEAWKIHAGDRPWDVMARAGIPHDEIMHKLDEAAKASGHQYEWHGSGAHRWLEVDGKSGTASVMKLIGTFIKQ